MKSSRRQALRGDVAGRVIVWSTSDHCATPQVRCCRNGLANAFYPADNIEPGHLADLVCGPAKSGARCPRDAAALRGAGLVSEGLAGLHAAQRLEHKRRLLGRAYVRVVPSA